MKIKNLVLVVMLVLFTATGLFAKVYKNIDNTNSLIVTQNNFLQQKIKMVVYVLQHPFILSCNFNSDNNSLSCGEGANKVSFKLKRSGVAYYKPITTLIFTTDNNTIFFDNGVTCNTKNIYSPNSKHFTEILIDQTGSEQPIEYSLTDIDNLYTVFYLNLLIQNSNIKELVNCC